ncbi:MAG: hypothetical protein LC099_07070 [Anaerolineales bacterium]|nr:hypothetical protein [Anaerolineales bacterium]
MTTKQSKKRVKKMFSDVPPATLEGSNDAPILAADNGAAQEQNPFAELEFLRERVRELEEVIAGKTSSAPIIYEKEKIGFAFSGDKVSTLRGGQPPIPSEAKVVQTPLVAGAESIGAVKIVAPENRPLSEEDRHLTDAVAKQVSTQIENLRLLAAAERARAEAEEATHQFTHRNWANYLDAIQNAERIGYAYDQSAVEAFTAREPAAYDHAEIMETLDEQIGRIYIQGVSALTEEDKKFIKSVAKQAGQQVENIRLLADASRARIEAEDASRRLTRQNWEQYTEREEAKLGYVYDTLTVSPLTDENVIADAALEEPLFVRGQAIGRLTVKGLGQLAPEEKALASSIAAQTSIHLEALRLTEELQKRAQELRELDRLKSAFLANMSHELRTPLNSILGFTDVMLEGLDGPLTDYMDNDLRLIQKNGQHLLHLINDVLDMAKIESGRMNLHFDRFNVNSLLEEVANIVSPLASDKRTALYIEPEADRELDIFADSSRLRQVIINLVTNSVKFTENGTVALNVARQENERVLITVKDNGLGIPPDQLESIFLEFTQVDTSTTRKVGGTGLGLPISRRLVEMHGGKLWAESSGVAGEGSAFYINLPIESVSSDEMEKREK